MENKKGVFHVLPVLIAVLFVAGVVLYTTINSSKGDVYSKTSVLSKDDDNSGSGSSGSGSGHDSDSNDDNSGSNSGSSNDDDTDIRIETNDNGIRTRTKVEDDKQRTDVFVDGQRFRTETKNGVTKFSVEDEDENEVEDENEATESGKIEHVGIRNRTNFPLTVNPDTNELIITTPAGERRITLPSVAIQNMINNGLFDEVVTAPDSTMSGEFEVFEDENNDLAFETETVDNQRFLGLFNVAIHKNVKFSAETGEVLNTNTPFFDRLLDLLSF